MESLLSDVGILAAAAVIIGSTMLFTQKTKSDKKVVVKQGSYGKVKIHKDSLLSQLLRPTEVIAMIRCKLMRKNGKDSSGLGYGVEALGNTEEEIKFCENKLDQVSRSFALVITFLPNTVESPLRLGVAIFYLVLRALDTVEDDMDLKKFKPFTIETDEKNSKDPQLNTKERLLRNFHKRFNKKDDQQKLVGLGEGDELHLLNNYQNIINVYHTLPEGMRNVIADITQEMGEGMADYVARDLREGTNDAKDFSKYCHIVAGTVGDGLTRLFAASGYESAELVKKVELWDSMGEFLQRTNIIRDYLEDFEDGRAFWPESVWQQYVKTSGTPSLGMLKESQSIEDGDSVRCLNHMIADALELVPAVLQYLENIHEPSILSFCALPQVMAIATLGKCYNNEKVFSGVVKLRKGLSATILLDFAPTTTPFTEERLRSSYKLWFLDQAKLILNTASATVNDENSQRVVKTCKEIITAVSN